MDTLRRTEAVQLNARDDNDVVVTPENSDRFMVSCREAVRAVEAGLGAKVIQEEFMSLLHDVEKWVSEHAQRIRECYVMPRDSELVFFVVPTSDGYDFELADELTEFDLKIAANFQYFSFSVQQIPGLGADSVSSFVNPAKAWKVTSSGAG